MFYVYVLFLIASGVMMLAMGSFRAAYARRGRIVNLVVGTGFTVYGLYLLIFFNGGHYFLFLYAFVVPVLLAVRFFRDRAAAGGGRRGMAPAGYGNGSQPPAYGNFPPAGYGVPQPPAYGGSQPPAYGGSQPPAYGAPQPPAYGGSQPPAYGNAPQPPYGNAPQAPGYGQGAAPAYGQGNVPPAYGNAPYGQPQQPQQQQGGSWS